MRHTEYLSHMRTEVAPLCVSFCWLHKVTVGKWATQTLEKKKERKKDIQRDRVLGQIYKSI